MTLLNIDPNLCREGPERAFVARAAMTHRGQAYLAGSGPAGKTCLDCARWQFEGKWSVQKGPFPARCAKYRDLMRGEWGPKVPHSAGSCKYFDQREKVIPQVKPEKAA